MLARRIAILASSVGFLFSGFAISDWNREVSLSAEELTEFSSNKKENQRNLECVLEEYHSLANDNNLTYDNIVSARYYSLEMFAVYCCAVNKKKELQDDIHFKERSSEALEEIIPKCFRQYTLKMTRRAMLRNFYGINWLNSVVHDEFLKYYAIPYGCFTLF